MPGQNLRYKDALPLPPEEIDAVEAANLLIAPWHHVGTRITEFSDMGRPFSALISWEHPDANEENGALSQREDIPHLILVAHDSEDPEWPTKPTSELVAQGLAFARSHPGRLLINCHAGKARSTALGYAILCDRLGPGREREALELLLAVRPVAAPNILIVRYADTLLNRGGRMEAEILSDPGVAERRERADRARWLALQRQMRDQGDSQNGW